MAPEKISYYAISVEGSSIELHPTDVRLGKCRETPAVVCRGCSHGTRERKFAMGHSTYLGKYKNKQGTQCTLDISQFVPSLHQH